jgi:sulfide dehydrogenase [flavocytochrome c] flavoprotein subunit
MLNRRSFTKVAVAGAALSMAACTGSKSSAKNGKKTVVVVGGGVGGATSAKYIKKYAQDVNVILIDKNKTYHTCFFGNNVIAGIQELESIEHNYNGLKAKGIDIVNEIVTKVDAVNKQVILENGEKIAYDKAVVASGIDFKWDSIPGHSEQASKFEIPHAYEAGLQTTILRNQLVNMKAGGTVVMIPPTNPFRCPPGPYERASLIAYYLKNNKPGSKLIILDQKEKFSKFGLFKQAWKKEYADIIDWRAKSKGGQVKHIDTLNRIVTTVSGKKIKADVINLIPAQKAGKVAFNSGLTKGDWCPINTITFESKIHKDIYVVGDSSIAAQMPKSGFSAYSQAKILAMQLTKSLQGKAPIKNTRFLNTCYSFINPNYAISVTGAYKGTPEKIAKTSGGLSPMNASASERKALAGTAREWYKGITSDIFL